VPRHGENWFWCVNWNWNVVSKPDWTDCFSRNQKAPDIAARVRVIRRALSETLASPQAEPFAGREIVEVDLGMRSIGGDRD